VLKRVRLNSQFLFVCWAKEMKNSFKENKENV